MDRIVYYYQYKTSRGTIRLLPEPTGRYRVVYNDENLGSYQLPEAAADDVGGGHTFTPSDGIEFDELGVPADFGEWKRKIFSEKGRLRLQN